MKKLLAVLILVLSLIACGDSSGVASEATPEATPTDTPTTSTALDLTPTHGKPQLGGPLSDFIGTYGAYQEVSATQYNFDDQATTNSERQTAQISVEVTGNTVTHLTTIALDGWGRQKGMAYGESFFPPDTTQIGPVSNDPSDPIQFTSPSIGPFGMLVNSFGDCTIYMPSS